MKIDQEYLKKLLEACQSFEAPTFTIIDFKNAGLDYHDPQFEFHMKILSDQGFVEQDDGESGIGLIKSADGSASWSVLPLRLTASGHQFVEAISNKEVWSTIKHSFKDASISTLRDVSIKLFEGYAQQKINKIPG
jgi:hypothetical protein